MGQADVVVLEQFVQNFLAGDPAGCMELVHPEVVLNEGASLPWGGDFVGPDGFERLIGMILADYDLTVESYDIADAGGYIAIRMRVTFKSRATGTSLLMPIVELYTLRDGLIWRADIFYKDTKAIADLHAEARGAVGA